MGRFKCAWCERDLGPSGTAEDSHGICKGCEKEFRENGLVAAERVRLEALGRKAAAAQRARREVLRGPVQVQTGVARGHQ